MPLQQMVLSATGGGITEYDTWADLPASPTDGDQALVGGVLYRAEGGRWDYVMAPAPEIPTSMMWEGLLTPIPGFVASEPQAPEIPVSAAPWALL
jgi:hypothetical protein